MPDDFIKVTLDRHDRHLEVIEDRLGIVQRDTAVLVAQMTDVRASIARISSTLHDGDASMVTRLERTIQDVRDLKERPKTARDFLSLFIAILAAGIALLNMLLSHRP